MMEFSVKFYMIIIKWFNLHVASEKLDISLLYIYIYIVFYAKRWKVQFRKGLHKFNNVDYKNRHILMRTAVLYIYIYTCIHVYMCIYLYMFICMINIASHIMHNSTLL